MLKARPGLVAVFKRKATYATKTRQVELVSHFVDLEPGEATYESEIAAWNEDGDPMVVGSDGLKVCSGANFLGVAERDPRVVQLMPADGWRIYRDDEEGGLWWCPVVAWALKSDGSIEPVETDYTGYADTSDKIDGVIRHISEGELTRARFDELMPSKATTKAIAALAADLTANVTLTADADKAPTPPMP